MKLVFLPSTVADVPWFRRYYRQVFPEGSETAREGLRRAQALLAENPEIGQPGEEPGTRELTIRRTPFAMIYRVLPDRIEILRLLDQRSGGPRG
ncbi:MAG: type II toxin-antitoxin system RelE/ParE family toxin [Paracoccaceae bacterium]